jgi:hypothetical protein
MRMFGKAGWMFGDAFVTRFDVRKRAMKNFEGSVDLFDACWRTYLRDILPGTDDPKCLDDVMNWLEQIASEKVNDSKSRFYIYG